MLTPKPLDGHAQWEGAYDTNDDQLVSKDDAKGLARHLHGAAVSVQLPIALTNSRIFFRLY